MAISNRKPAHKPPQTASAASSGAVAGAGAALAPYLFDETDLMTHQAMRRNVQASQEGLDRFLTSIRSRLPNNGSGWIVRADQKGFDPPKTKAVPR
ncbi:MAG: hypothetical protein ACRD9L_16340 [Bryobacteraceae bacterium]